MTASQDDVMLSDEEAAAEKKRQTTADARKWITIVRPDPLSAVNFVNFVPAQVAGEAVFAHFPDGRVQVYYFA
jgi:hypothetical protein